LYRDRQAIETLLGDFKKKIIALFKNETITPTTYSTEAQR
jgi:hypothetical protein